jgi:hypothetical protein
MNLQWLVGSWPHKNANKINVPADIQHREFLMGSMLQPSNLANNLFASSCDSLAAAIALDTSG